MSLMCPITRLKKKKMKICMPKQNICIFHIKIPIKIRQSVKYNLIKWQTTSITVFSDALSTSGYVWNLWVYMRRTLICSMYIVHVHVHSFRNMFFHSSFYFIIVIRFLLYRLCSIHPMDTIVLLR